MERRVKESASSAQPGPEIRRRVRTEWVILFDGLAILGILAVVFAVFVVAQFMIDRGTAGDPTGGVVLPIVKASYETTAEFGDSGPNWANGHTGLDFAASEGTQIHAVSAGVVIYARNSGGPYGNLTKIFNSDGTESWYAHQSRISVQRKEVAAGQVIGAVGASGNVTGAHLHLEIRKGILPTDPRSWLSARGVIP